MQLFIYMSPDSTLPRKYKGDTLINCTTGSFLSDIHIIYKNSKQTSNTINLLKILQHKNTIRIRTNKLLLYCDYYAPLLYDMSLLKANMNSDIPLQTAAIFFSDELLSETGYWLGVCHGWFHLHGIPLAARSRSEIYKTKSTSRP